MQRSVDWNQPLSDLPDHLQAQLEHTMRTVLKRRLKQGPSVSSASVPDAVRSQAIGIWRKHHMKGASTAAKRRMNYARLRDEPTYQALERELLGHYWAKRLGVDPANLPTPSDVDDMSFAEVCQTFYALCPRLGSTGLEHLVGSELKEAYRQNVHPDAICNHMEQRILKVVRTHDLTTYARISLDNQPFHLRDATNEGHVCSLVMRAHVVEHVLHAVYGKCSPRTVATCMLIEPLRTDSTVQSLQDLMGALLDTPHPLDTRLQRLARRDAKRIVDRIYSDDFARLVAAGILENPIYRLQYDRAVELMLRVREHVPQTPMEAFPLARTMHRRFVIHVGPTNSGKTHDALRALAASTSGAYLGPLRLLAYEQFEHLNHDGCPCSLLTGEEAIEVAGAKHTSSTVEMANFSKIIELAVIDEAQMIADPSRGHHWTDAILGIPALEVHVCCAPHAMQVVTKLVRLCGDEYEVVRHERLVPLRRDSGSFHLPDDVQPGDALVVFSRQSVHAVASIVSAASHRPSLIYGALPHEVRHEEARKFDEGTTDVVVATDAIGMGMNLPIRRIVFIELEKYDGREFRILRADELQQIAGRAGRYGRYDLGLFQSLHMRREVTRRIAQIVPNIETIAVGIPANIALVRDATLSDSIRRWMAIEQPEPFARIDVSRECRLVAEAEALLDSTQATNTDTKLTVLSLATMPFDERDHRLLATWRQMARAQLSKGASDSWQPVPSPDGKNLSQLEADYRYCDLLYTYERTFRGDRQRIDELVARRSAIARAIMTLLETGTSGRLVHAT